MSERDESKKQLFRVRFRQVDLWPDYAGAPGDTIDVEIYVGSRP